MSSLTKLGVMNLAGQLMILGTVYYMAYATSWWALGTLAVGHALFEVSNHIAKKNLLKEIEEFTKNEEYYNQVKGNC